MNHCGTKTIETERLLLRAFRESDVEAVFRNWTSDERVTEFLCWETHTDISETEQVLSEIIEQSKNPDFYNWAIVLKEIGEPIGTINVLGHNDKVGMVHISYMVGSKWWHKGITTEALRAIIPFLFNEVGANRIEARYDPENQHSGNVMKKCGFTYEGTLRQADFGNKGIIDAAMYSLLKSEWSQSDH